MPPPPGSFKWQPLTIFNATTPSNRPASKPFTQVTPTAHGSRAPFINKAASPLWLQNTSTTMSDAEELFGSVFAARGWEARQRQWTPEAKVLCAVLASTVHRVLFDAHHPAGEPAVVGIVDVVMGDWTWMPYC